MSKLIHLPNESFMNAKECIENTKRLFSISVMHVLNHFESKGWSF